MDVVNALAESWPRRAPMRPPFAEVAREHLDDVFRYLVFLTADPVLAEDLTGETLEKGLHELEALRPAPRFRAHLALPARSLEGARPLRLGGEKAPEGGSVGHRGTSDQ